MIFDFICASKHACIRNLTVTKDNVVNARVVFYNAVRVLMDAIHCSVGEHAQFSRCFVVHRHFQTLQIHDYPFTFFFYVSQVVITERFRISNTWSCNASLNMCQSIRGHLLVINRRKERTRL